ncbi:hypothetical protein MtrunA17_Chr3g0139151 [Medicago truncatula]|uniref:Uncharacterized protein n=1 Tax=Medicago truncatula TaxID=3880 RepID=A0A396J2Z2_MEDTR|nr:hypothetical protein MtrunA17_Chr3g0139151 [Medicago truncatula]
MNCPFKLMTFPSGPMKTKAGIFFISKILQRSCLVLSSYGIASQGMLVLLTLNSLRSLSVETKTISKQWPFVSLRLLYASAS